MSAITSTWRACSNCQRILIGGALLRQFLSAVPNDPIEKLGGLKPQRDDFPLRRLTRCLVQHLECLEDAQDERCPICRNDDLAARAEDLGCPGSVPALQNASSQMRQFYLLPSYRAQEALARCAAGADGKRGEQCH